LGNLNNVLKRNLIQRQSQLKVCNILAIPLLLYGCEMWTVTQRDIRRLQTAEMKFMRHSRIQLIRPQKEWRHCRRS